MTRDVLIVGGGMAGLAAALACAREGLGSVLLEQATGFSEVGAGIQLGPNAVRVLDDWGLTPKLQDCAAFPDQLQVRDAGGGALLGRLPLGPRVKARYGQPYATIHRADLHTLLLDAVREMGLTECLLAQRVDSLLERDGMAEVRTETGQAWSAPVLLGCDGLWSRIRKLTLQDGEPEFSGHLAYRGLLRMSDLPPALRSNTVTAWLGSRMHAVHYPVRSGDWLNVVVVVHGDPVQGQAGWDHEAQARILRQSLATADAQAPDLLAVVDAVPGWRLWPLNERPVLRGAGELARGRVALLGDAGHPMRPYLAQGAAMALEDAWTLGRMVRRSGKVADWPDLLQRWAQIRWTRNAWVQARSRRNGNVFHAQGLMRWGRNLAMNALGESLLDVPDLYRGPPPV